MEDMVVNFKFENQGTNTYLVYQIAETDEMDSMSLGMLTNNHIPGFAPASFTQMDMTKYIKFNVSAEVSVKQLFTGPVNKKRLLGVFTGVVEAMLSAEEYMLDPSTILLDTDYIFADVSTCQAELVCLPIMNLQQQNPDLATFFKNILFTTQFDQTENCDHVAQLINYLNTNPVLVLDDFKNLLNTLSHGAAPAAPAAPAQPVQPAPQPVVQAPVQPAPQPVAQTPVQPVQRPQPAQIPVQPPVQPVQPAQKNVPPMPQGMQIPGAAPAPNNAPAAPQGMPDGKPMTLMYLMQHYTKENAAIYKAQQEAAKQKKGAAAKAAPAKPVAAPMPGKAAPAKPQPGPGFAIPGQAPSGFAIPGQPAPAPAAPVAPVAPKPAPAPVAPVNPMPAAPITPMPQPAYQPAPQSAPLNFGETTVLSAAVGETTVLGGVVETKQNDPHLIRVKNNEKIPLNKPVFRIGKEKSYVDYFISDNTAISRSHANIIDHNGEFFVVDTNSTNHTYVNGGMIQSGVETKLSHGTKIRFANEEFEFKLY